MFTFLAIRCCGGRYKKPMILPERRLFLVRMQKVLSFSLDEYSNNLTVDVLILHITVELFLWL